MRLWFARTEVVATETESFENDSFRKASYAYTQFRDLLVQRIRRANQTSAHEVGETARHLNEIVDRARAYVQNIQHALAPLQTSGQDRLGKLLVAQGAFLRKHSADMSARAILQDERARQAAASARSIADLAESIERLAGEARLLAVNARIESSRLGSKSAGFEVLASEMQRLSDEVASTNERVGKLAGRLGEDLPWIAQHARDFREAMSVFATASSVHISETERGTVELRTLIANIAQAGNAVMHEILAGSRAALSHLQFQDVVAQKLRQLDGIAQRGQLEMLRLLDARPEVFNEVPSPEYTTAGDAIGGEAAGAPAGEVILF